MDPDGSERVREQIVEHAARAIAQVDIGEIREVPVAVRLHAVAAEEGDDAIDTPWTRLQHQRVDHREHAGVDADPEGEDADRHEREPRRPTEQSKTVTEVLQHRALAMEPAS